MKQLDKYKNGKWVLWSFVTFFSMIVIVNSFFLYKAISTHTGVVTDNAYEKGLAYNDMLEKAQNQPKWTQKATYKEGILRWKLSDENGAAITGALVAAKVIRPIHKGYDFDITLEHKGAGIYEAIPSLPLQGHWLAKLSGTWNNKKYQTAYEFMKN